MIAFRHRTGLIARIVLICPVRRHQLTQAPSAAMTHSSKNSVRPRGLGFIVERACSPSYNEMQTALICLAHG